MNEIPIDDGRRRQDVDFASSCKVWEALDSSVAGDGPALQNPALLPTPADLNPLFGWLLYDVMGMTGELAVKCEGTTNTKS